MMILKTSRLSLLILLLFSLQARALNTFECLRDIMQVTDRGNYQKKRTDVERPFMVGDKHMVFPEVVKRKVTGFFVYDHKSAWYYDAVEIKEIKGKKTMPIADLSDVKERAVYQMVVQPAGLETITIYFLPGFDVTETNSEGPVMLGSTVLPIVGAIVSRPEKYDPVYTNPTSIDEDALKKWFYTNSSGRRPASANEMQINRKIVSLITQSRKEDSRLWQPITNELKIRQDWIKAHNLDEASFKEISRAMDHSCR